MKSKIGSYLLMGTLLLASSAFANDSVTAADSDDIEKFDQALAKSPDKDASGEDAPKKDAPKKDAKDAKANFGGIVSKEAHKMHGDAPAGYKNFGQWVSSQRRKNGDHDADDRAVSGNGPGESGSHPNLGQVPGAGRPANQGGSGGGKKPGGAGAPPS